MTLAVVHGPFRQDLEEIGQLWIQGPDLFDLAAKFLQIAAGDRTGNRRSNGVAVSGTTNGSASQFQIPGDDIRAEPHGLCQFRGAGQQRDDATRRERGSQMILTSSRRRNDGRKSRKTCDESTCHCLSAVITVDSEHRSGRFDWILQNGGKSLQRMERSDSTAMWTQRCECFSCCATARVQDDWSLPEPRECPGDLLQSMVSDGDQEEVIIVTADL